jgi:hypothetical protein
VRNLRESPEGKGRVLRCVLSTVDGRAYPVEMRGDELRGVIDEGDRVAVALEAVSGRRDDPTLRPREIRNLTTGGVVEMWRADLLHRALRALPISAVLTAAVSAAVGAAVGAGLAGALGDEGGQGIAPPPQDQGDDTLVIAGLVAAGLLALGAAAIALVRVTSRRWIGRRALLVAGGFLVGFALVAIAVGLSET